MVGPVSYPPPRGYQAYYSSPDPAGGHRGGCAILVSSTSNIPSTRFPLHSQLEAVAVQLHLQRLYTVCCLYLPPGRAVSREEVLALIDELPPPFLLLGDFNARNHLWGDSITDPRGAIMESIISERDLSILNTGEPTHNHVQTDSYSVLDLSICTSNVSIDFMWEVLNDLHGSDHYPVVLHTPDTLGPPRLPR